MNTLDKQLVIEQKVIELVQEIRRDQPYCGTKKLYEHIKKDLNSFNIKIGRDAIHNILKNNNLIVRKMKTHHITTLSKHQFYKFPNLVKNFFPTAPEQVFVADITYIDCQEKPLYLHLVTDLYSKKLMGFELSDNLKAESSLNALKMALNNRIYPNQTLIHHSDRGIQYCSKLYTEFTAKNNIRMSMTNNGDPYENAVAERINRTLKHEFGLKNRFPNYKIALKATKQAVHIYNNIRLHLSCNMLTPQKAHLKANFKYKSWAKTYN